MSDLFGASTAAPVRADSGICSHLKECSFARAVGSSPVLMARFARLHHYCKKGGQQGCARQPAYAEHSQPSDALLPDGKFEPSLLRRPHQVLVVEPTPIFRVILENVIASTLFESRVHHASDSGSALSIARCGHFDLVIAEFVLEGHDGAELVHDLRTTEQTRKTPVVVVGNEFDSAEHQARVHQHPAARWVHHSHDHALLKAAVAELVLLGRV